MALYNLEARFPVADENSIIKENLSESMWNLFVAIGKFWAEEIDVSFMKSNFLVFLSNRVEVDPNYRSEYKNAREVINELITEVGENEGYKKLLTDVAANIAPPTTRLARARQLVSNEFIILFLALGGFKKFGDGALNYPGYFGGANFENLPPYRTYEDKI
jgi:hypothetical protein